MKNIQLNKCSVRFDADEHRYWLGDTELHGVTSTLIRRAFPNKYKDIDPDVLANAARKGKELHEAIEFFDQFGGDPGQASDGRIASYARIKEEYNLTTIANEYLVSDLQHYASSIDIVMQDDFGKVCLVDIKTTFNLDKASTGLQLSIYKRWFEQQNPDLHVEHLYVLWLPNKDHSIAELHELCLVDDDTLDKLIAADLADEPFTFDIIPDEWAELEREYAARYDVSQLAEQRLAETRDRMMNVMLANNISSVRTGYATVSYIPAKTTRRFDSATFRKENADLYNSYMKETESAPQLRVLTKKKEQ